MGRLWKVDGEDKSCNGSDSEGPMPHGNPTLLKGQTVIGFDGKLKKTTAAPGNAVVLVYLASFTFDAQCLPTTNHQFIFVS